jgi:ribonuclease D
MLANRTQLIALDTPIGSTWDDRYNAAHFLNWQRSIWNGILHIKLTR